MAIVVNQYRRASPGFIYVWVPVRIPDRPHVVDELIRVDDHRPFAAGKWMFYG